MAKALKNMIVVTTGHDDIQLGYTSFEKFFGNVASLTPEIQIHFLLRLSISVENQSKKQTGIFRQITTLVLGKKNLETFPFFSSNDNFFMML